MVIITKERLLNMSIQTKVQKVNGKDVVYYYPVVSTYKINKSKTPLWGKGFLKKSDAIQEEARMRTELGNLLSASHKKKKKMKFRELREAWQNTRVTKETTTYERDLDFCKYYLSVFDDILLSDITALTIQKWTTLLSTKYKPKTVNMAFNLLSQIMDFGVSPLKVLENNPCCENIQRPKVRKKGVESDQFWSEAELKFFVNHEYTKVDSYYRMYTMHAAMGFRPGEICGISIYDLNLSMRLITLNHGLDKKSRLTDLKNSGAQRTLKLPKSLIQPLEEQIQYSNSVRDKKSKYPFLFVLDTGKPINPDTYCQHLQRLIQRINENSKDMQLKPITPYGLRHTFATLSLLKKVYIKEVAEAMGDSVETVMQNYAHIIEQMSGDSAELMADTIFNND